MDTGSWFGPGFNMYWVIPLLCLVFMAAAMFMMYRCRSGGCASMHAGATDSPPETRETPRQILDRRLASGALTPEQHASMRREIESGRVQS